MLVDEVAVQARGHPQLQRGIEGVVGHRTRRRRSHLAVRGVDGGADQCAVGFGADCRDGQIRSGGPGPFERMLVDVAAVDRALQHAVADSRQGQLHDHVGRGQQCCRRIQQVGDAGERAASSVARLHEPSRPRVRRCRSVWHHAAGPGCGVLLGYLADLVLGDPRAGHPVAGFGAAASALERVTYRDSRAAGAVYVAVLVGAVSLVGVALERQARRCGAFGSVSGDRDGDLGRARRNIADAHRISDGRAARAAMTWTAPAGCCRRCVDVTRRRWMPRG